MTMLALCSAASSYSSNFQISVHGEFMPTSSYQKTFGDRCILEDKVVFGFSNGNHFQRVSLRSYSMGAMSSPYMVVFRDLKFVESPSESVGEEELLDFTDRVIDNANLLPKSADPLSITTTDVISDDSTLISDSLSMKADSLSNLKTSVEDVFGGVNESISASTKKGEYALTSTLDTITSTVTSAFKGVNEAVDSAFGKVMSAVDQTGDSAGNTLSVLANDSKEAFGKLGSISVDVLRQSILVIEDYLRQGGTFVVYAYGSAKELLPPDIQNVLNISEEKADKILRPAGTAFQQVYSGLEGLERSLGLDPNDPIVTFVLLLGTSGTLWGAYWFLTYAGYAGDLTPQMTLELLTGKDNAVLIDVRPEDFRKRDGIPDLRRAARFRYASVAFPEVEGSVRKLLKTGKDLDDTLIAAVIRNLKIVQDRSKVIVLDVDGTRSKGIARSLRKLGVKRPYLVLGGFRSWVKEGLRIKGLKPQTALTILNEEAEAIIEEVNPTPLKVLGYGMVFIAAVYAISEWEKTLQFIGVVGLALTIYWRLASYEDSEDFKQDLRQLLVPVRLGGQAISWAAGKLETNGIGLPTSPSSSDVQSRVLQAAAKHESQPSDSEELPVPPADSTTPVNENVDIAEA